MRDVTRRMFTGAAWMVLARVLDRSVGFVSTIILARLLVPADFGLVSLATAILAGLELLGAFSFDMALIQNQNAERSHYDTAWTIGLMFAALFASAMVALSYPAASWFNDPRLSAVMQFLSVGVLAGGLTNVGVVAFRKELQFDKEFRLLLAKRLVTFTVTISFAYLWRDYWALVAGTVTGMVIAVPISYLMHPYRPRLSLAKWGELFNFSRWLFVNNTLGFVYYKAADFIVAKTVNTTGLGYYSVAYDVANLPSTELVMPVNRAVFPGYSMMSSDLAALRQGYLNVVSMVAMLAIPASIGLGCVAAPLVNAFFGPKWIAVITLIPAIAIHGLLTAIVSCGNYAFLALGKPRHVTLLMSVHISMAIPLLTFFTLKWGVQGAPWALLLASVLLQPLNYFLLTTTLKVTISDLLKALWRPVIGTAVMVECVFWLQSTVDFDSSVSNQIVKLLMLASAGAATYCVTVFALWHLIKRPDGPERFLRNQIIRRLRPNATFHV